MKDIITLAIGLGLLTAGCAPSSQSDASSQNQTQYAIKQNTPAIKTLASSHDFTQTLTRLEAGLAKRPLTLFAKIDHAAGAAKAELTLTPSTLYVFGNPKGGTPLMTRNAQMGIVLPLKMHVYQDGDGVKVSYTDIVAETKAHGLDSTQLPIPNIAKMLDGLANEVTAP